jgi:hypothetical protein
MMALFPVDGTIASVRRWFPPLEQNKTFMSIDIIDFQL